MGAASVKQVPEPVPSTLPDAVKAFLRHPSIAMTVSAIAVLSAARSYAPLEPLDAFVAVVTAVFWLFQEHFIHDKLLHSTFPWAGREIHHAHHTRPYHHVSIDEPPLVVAFMAASAAIFYTLFLGHPVFLSATISYYLSGLWYMWTHYLVHTRYIPRSKLLRTIRTNHMLHHCRNEGYWFSFGAPIIDHIFGTAPPPSSVPISGLAKLAIAPRATPKGSGPDTLVPEDVVPGDAPPAAAAPQPRVLVPAAARKP